MIGHKVSLTNTSGNFRAKKNALEITKSDVFRKRNEFLDANGTSVQVMVNDVKPLQKFLLQKRTLHKSWYLVFIKLYKCKKNEEK